MGWMDWLLGTTDPNEYESEVSRAISHNEARGDPVPPEWYALEMDGRWFFPHDEEE